MKTSTKIALLSIVAGVAITTFLLLNNKKKSTTDEYDYVSDDNGSTSSGGNYQDQSLDYNKKLKVGSKGKEVRILQEALNRWPTIYLDPNTGLMTDDKLQVDGNFGLITESNLFARTTKKSISLSEIGIKE